MRSRNRFTSLLPAVAKTFVCLSFLAVSVSPHPSWADSATPAGSGPPAPTPGPSSSAVADPVIGPDQPAFTYGGSADFYYAHNFNEPFNKKNQLRAFDIQSDGDYPHLGLIDL